MISSHNTPDNNRKVENLTGKVLISSPTMDDEFFKKSIVYVCAHDEDGAIGVILNRCIGEIDIYKILRLKTKARIRKPSAPLYLGGPVSQDSLLILGVKKEHLQDFDNNPIITIYSDLADFCNSLIKNYISYTFFIAQGMTSWTSKQLIEEVGQNSWFITHPNKALLFSAPRTKLLLWDKVTKAMGLFDHAASIVNYSGQA